MPDLGQFSVCKLQTFYEMSKMSRW